MPERAFVADTKAGLNATLQVSADGRRLSRGTLDLTHGLHIVVIAGCHFAKDTSHSTTSVPGSADRQRSHTSRTHSSRPVWGAVVHRSPGTRRKTDRHWSASSLSPGAHTRDRSRCSAVAVQLPSARALAGKPASVIARLTETGPISRITGWALALALESAEWRQCANRLQSSPMSGS